jgi:quinol monooxygenase YgiN
MLREKGKKTRFHQQDAECRAPDPADAARVRGLLALSSEDEPERTVSISFWKSRADAERYHREHFDEIIDAVCPLLRDEPSVEFYNVEASTAHRIAAGKAA